MEIKRKLYFIWVAILISDKIDVKTKTVIREKGHYIVIKGSIQEDITIANIYAPNIGASQILTTTKGEMYSNTSAHETSSRIDYMLGHKVSLREFKKIENHIKHHF